MSTAAEKYEAVIGLEVHAQLSTKSKAYSSDPNEYGAAPNSNVSAVTLGHPGTLPVMNTKTVEYAVRLGLACQSEISRSMHFARKNYFYPDLPKGYQITQDTTPICTGGSVIIKTESGPKEIGLTRIHMEEDAGKSIHDQDPYNTLVDLNRAGVPLVEIVSEPDMRTSEEAYAYLTEIRKLVRYLDICDGNMEEGSLRCDANISIRLKGSETFGDRVEVKNMNSIRNVARAIEHEVVRQAEILEAGGKIDVETRTFNAVSGTTASMRSKEMAHDYRYFPEPDLLPLQLTEEYIEKVRAALPKLPNELFDRYTKEFGLSEYDAGVLTDSKEIALYFEELISHTGSYKTAANWIMGSVKSYLNQQAIGVDEFPLKASQIAELIDGVEAGKFSNAVATQKIFPELIKDPSQTAMSIAEANDWIQETDEDEIVGIVREAIAGNPAQVEKYKNGNHGLVGFFMGEVMKRTGGKADPKAASSLVRKLLDEA